jgi:hypothetical protein
MGLEEAVVPAIQVVLASWVAMVTAGAGYLFVQNTRLLHAVRELKSQVEEVSALVPWARRLGLAKRLSDEEDDKEVDGPAA